MLMSLIGKRREYGWMESVERQPNAKKEALSRVAKLCVFPILHANDLLVDALVAAVS